MGWVGGLSREFELQEVSYKKKSKHVHLLELMYCKEFLRSQDM